jgi:hypothetical protein
MSVTSGNKRSTDQMSNKPSPWRSRPTQSTPRRSPRKPGVVGSDAFDPGTSAMTNLLAAPCLFQPVTGRNCHHMRVTTQKQGERSAPCPACLYHLHTLHAQQVL